ncbi:MAG: beta-N-acetylglucosaminidase domain-containing protein [Actinomycetota bacterium]
MNTLHNSRIDVNRKRWLGAVEGYYGRPLDPRERIDLVRWLGAHGFNTFAHAPKDDPLHRRNWRDPYPAERLAEFAELVAEGERAGVAVAMVVSPGLDWTPGTDEAPLVEKLRSLAATGARALGVAFDDVPPGGAELGSAHAAAVAAAVDGLGDGFRWVTCPTDYATDVATPYLRSFFAGLPEGVDVMWTGPSIVSPTVDADCAARLGQELGRPLLFAENYPVNDGPMAGVLHLGPYRGRDPRLPEVTTGVFFNFMSFPLASRVGLACGARFWQDPTGDPEAVWRECLREFPGIERLARASRAWIGDPDPDAEIAGWVDQVIAGGDPQPLIEFLDVDLVKAIAEQPACESLRAELDPALAEEVAAWVDQWEAEAVAMRAAIEVIRTEPARRADYAFATAETWARARHARQQLFGVRWAYYPVTEWRDGSARAVPAALIEGENLTDRLCRFALEGKR